MYQEEGIIISLLRECPSGISPPHSKDRFLSLCHSHGLNSLIHKCLVDRTPFGTKGDAILRDLAWKRRQILAQNIYLIDQLRKFKKTLTRADVPFIVLKGISLLGFLFQDFSLRQLDDIDVLINKRNLNRVLEILRDSDWKIPDPQEISLLKKRWYNLCVLSSDPIPARIEIHWFLESELRDAVNLAELWERKVLFELEGIKLWRLSNEDLFIHLMIHLAKHVHAPRAKWVYDVHALLNHCELDWDKIISSTKRWRISAAMFSSVAYVEKIFPGTIPMDFAVKQKMSWGRMVIFRAAKSSSPLLLLAPGNGHVLRRFYSLLLIDRFRDLGRFLLKYIRTRGSGIQINKR